MWCRKKIFFLFFSIFRTRMKVKHQIFFLFFVYLVLWRVFEKFISVFFQPAKKKRIFLEFFTNLKLRNNNLFSCIKKILKETKMSFTQTCFFFSSLSTIIPVERRNMKIGSAIELSYTCKRQQGFQSLLTNPYQCMLCSFFSFMYFCVDICHSFIGTLRL